MATLNFFEEDYSKFEKGTPLHIEPDGMIFVRRISDSYKPWVDAMKRALEERHGYAANINSLSEEQQLELIGHALASYAVSDWDNIEYPTGVKLECTLENRMKIFTDNKFFRSINEAVLVHGKSYWNYLKEELNEDIELAKKQ